MVDVTNLLWRDVSEEVLVQCMSEMDGVILSHQCICCHTSSAKAICVENEIKSDNGERFDSKRVG